MIELTRGPGIERGLIVVIIIITELLVGIEKTILDSLWC